MTIEKFTGKALIYEKYRPTYPKAFIDYLYADEGFSDQSVIADIGSGTGILSKQLLEMGSHVIGVEPNNEMRQLAEKKCSSYVNYSSVNGAAEHTTLPDNSVNFITVAQAFHWFDAKRFYIECQRILKNNGKVVLVWNSRNTNDEITKESERICEQCCPEFKGFSGGMEENSEEIISFFKDGHCEVKTFDNNVLSDLDHFIGRFLSSSFAPKENEPNYKRFVDGLTELFMKYSDNGVLTITHTTRSYAGNV